MKNVSQPPIYFNEIEVSETGEHKYIGLILDSKLSFSKHIMEKIKNNT